LRRARKAGFRLSPFRDLDNGCRHFTIPSGMAEPKRPDGTARNTEGTLSQFGVQKNCRPKDGPLLPASFQLSRLQALPCHATTHSGSVTSTVVISASGSKGTSVVSISSAPILSDFKSSCLLLSCALTPGKSTNQPIHQFPVFFIIALYFMELPHKGDFKVSADLSSQFIHNFPMPRRLGLHPRFLKNAMPSPFADKKCPMTLEMFYQLTSFVEVHNFLDTDGI